LEFEVDTIQGCLERITYHNSETGFTVAKMLLPKKKEEVCVVGTMPGVKPGETLNCSGSWKRHLLHGWQFEVVSCEVATPTDVFGIEKYLGSGLVKGIGPHFAAKIVAVFGEETLDVIDKDPQKLREVQGIGNKRLNTLIASWDEQKIVRNVMVFLQGHGVSPSFALKIFKKYGQKSIETVQKDPYCLAREIHGIGFKSADKIAEKMGVLKNAPERIDAGVEFSLFELSNEGHVCYPLEEFVKEAETILEVPIASIYPRLPYLIENRRIAIEPLIYQGKTTDFIWVKRLYQSEKGIATELQRLNFGVSGLRTIDKQKALSWVQSFLGIELALNQQKAVMEALSQKILVITGGPGTGKSTITNAILQITKKLTSKILLTAPTGRAAKRMSEITGFTAKTIHSLLEFDFQKGGFKRNQECPLEADLIIVDEASMIDTVLMYSLLRAIPTSCRLIIIGDVNQLPSVGPGNVLKDIISSQAVSVAKLTEIFRQAKGSKIIVNAHKINEGVMPDTKKEKDSDFFFIDLEEKEDVLNEIVNLVSNRLPKTYPFDPIDQIQVLSPMRKGILGTENLNTALQKELNPSASPQFIGGSFFATGDKVMQIQNNYDKEVFNGDIGRLVEINQKEALVTVDFEGKLVEYAFTELDELVLAYAVSIHKYQGSESSCVVIPIHTTHFMMLKRNLIYTAVTRGKKLVVLVGSKRALAIGVNNDDVKNRYTGLVQALTSRVLL
jgi:exodeoxyribonuclease V alpha subunit